MSGILWFMFVVAVIGMYAAFRWGYDTACQDFIHRKSIQQKDES